MMSVSPKVEDSVSSQYAWSATCEQDVVYQAIYRLSIRKKFQSIDRRYCACGESHSGAIHANKSGHFSLAVVYDMYVRDGEARNARTCLGSDVSKCASLTSWRTGRSSLPTTHG